DRGSRERQYLAEDPERDYTCCRGENTYGGSCPDPHFSSWRLPAVVKHTVLVFPHRFSCLRPWSASVGLNRKTQERHLEVGCVSTVSQLLSPCSRWSGSTSCADMLQLDCMSLWYCCHDWRPLGFGAINTSMRNRTMIHTAPRVRMPGGYREVVCLALPVIVSMLTQTLTSALESAFLGRFGTVEQGAAGLGGALLWPILIACNCSGMGVQIWGAQSMGAQRRPGCGAITWQGVYITGLAWLPMFVLGLYALPLVRLIAPSPELLEPTALYLRIQLLGGLPALLNMTMIGFFRGLGDTRTPLVVVLVVEFLSVLLDILLIFGVAGCPRLGIAGAALSTVICRTVGTVIYLGLFLHRGRREGFLVQLRLPFDRHACWHLLRVSWPIGAQGALEMGAWTLFTAFIARLGTVEAAAHA